MSSQEGPSDPEEGLDEAPDRKNWEEIFFKFRWPIVFVLVGLLLTALGVIFSTQWISSGKPGVEVLEDITRSEDSEKSLVVEVSGAVASPGVYELPSDARVDDALVAAGGTTTAADSEWMGLTLNRAAKVTDGQKIYIKSVGEETVKGVYLDSEVTNDTPSGVVNINTGSQSALESLWGIGPVTAQNIIEGRPYSSVEELLTKKLLKQNVYDKNKDLLTVY